MMNEGAKFRVAVFLPSSRETAGTQVSMLDEKSESKVKVGSEVGGG